MLAASLLKSPKMRTNYPDIPNPDLLDRIPLNAHVVLDVGCATGSLGLAYKRRNPTCRFIGVEQNVRSASIAAKRLDMVYVADLDSDQTPFVIDLQEHSLDCIIYGDMLEHLREPWKILQTHLYFLAEEGNLLICVPNVEHWSFVEQLLRGTWEYDDSGLFDNTHLRWFSQDSMRKGLASIGLQVIDVTPRVFEFERSQTFVDAVTPGLRKLGIDPQDYLRRAAPLQHVWRVRRSACQTLSIVATMLNPVGGVSHVRVLEPMRALATDPALRTQVIAAADLPLDRGDRPGILVLHRPLLAGQHGLARLRDLIAEKWLIVCEFDDHPDYIPVLQRPDIQNFRAVHAIQTTTETLAAVLRQQNREVAVFPNAILELPALKNFVTPDFLNLVFAGLNRENEWPMYLDALNAVGKRAGDKLHFHIVGDRGLFDALRTKHKYYIPICDYETYRSLLARSEISFMPLSDTPFNRCKSDLKFIEAASYGVAAIASRVVYGKSVEDGRTGLLFRDAAELEQRLYRLVANPDVARDIGEASRKYVTANRMLTYQTAVRAEWYHSLWARRDQLQLDLIARIPELKVRF
jgi:glycosyltransferase involved in cell wall biosynthesis